MKSSKKDLMQGQQYHYINQNYYGVHTTKERKEKKRKPPIKTIEK
jgi:hypothetical protein